MLFTVLSLCIESSSCKLGLIMLARLETCSKATRRAVGRVIRQQAPRLLPGALNSTANHSTPEKLAEALPAFSWLIKRLGRHALSSQSAIPLMMPYLPAILVSALLEAGLRPTQRDLIAAARNRIPGIEAFVRSHFSGMSATVEIICCHKGDHRCVEGLEQHLPYLAPEDAPDLLFLAVNMPHAAAAMHLLKFLVSQNERENALLQQQKLEEMQLLAQHEAATRAKQRKGCQEHLKKRQRLVLAAIAPHFGPLLSEEVKQQDAREREVLQQRHMLEQQQLQQHCEQLRQKLATPGLLQDLIVTASARHHQDLLADLLSLPEAHALDAAFVASLLRSAIKAQSWDILHILEQLPAAAQLQPKTTASLLQLVISQRFKQGLHPVCQLPGFTTEAATEALEAAMHRDWVEGATVLIGMHQTQAMSSSRLLQLLQLAMRLRGGSYLHHLCSVPSAHGIGVLAFHQLLKTAMQCRWMDDDTLKSLLSLYAAQQLQTAQVAEVLWWAIHLRVSANTVQQLSNLPAAQHISAASMGQMLSGSLSNAHLTDDYNAFLLLCGMPAAQQDGLNSFASDLVRDAMAHSCLDDVDQDPTKLNVYGVEVINSLCSLPAMQRLGAEAVARLVDEAVCLQRNSMLLHLSNLPAAAELQPTQIEHLLRGAIMLGNSPGVFLLCTRFPAAQNISAAVVSGLLQLSIEQGNPARPSDSDDSDDDSDDDDANRLAEAALVVHQLCKLQGAQQMSRTAMTSLLCTAATLNDRVCQFEALLALPGADELSAAETANLLELCTQDSSSRLMQSIIGAGAVTLLDEGVVASVLKQVQEERVAEQGGIGTPSKLEQLLEELMKMKRFLKDADQG